jgi:cytochrome P450
MTPPAAAAEGPPALPPRFDAFSLARVDDPYPVYARLREDGPILRAGPGQWLVTRHAEVSGLLRDRRLGQFRFADAYELFPGASLELTLGDGPASDFTRRIVAGLDGARHTRVRRIVGQRLAPTRVRALRPRVAKLAERAVSELDDGIVEVVGRLAFPLPLTVLSELLGIPAADRDRVGRTALVLNRMFAAVVPEADRIASDAAVTWLRGYMDGLAAERSRAPGDDLLSDLLGAVANGKLTHEELVDNAIFVLYAGLETSMTLIASAGAVLARHPTALGRLRADRSLVRTAVEEILRYDAPTQLTARIARERIEVGGHAIREGRVVLLLLASANRDERQFAHPGRLDVGRHPNPHVSFGAGVHYCVGAALARLEATLVLDRLLDRFAVLEPAADPVRERGATVRSYVSVPIEAHGTPR